MKLKKTIAIDEDLYEWLLEKVKEKEFGSISHGIAKALVMLREDYQKKAKQKEKVGFS